MEGEERLFIPVLVGTTRKGRWSIHPARLVAARLVEHPLVETELVDLASLAVAVDDVGLPTRDPALAGLLGRADGLVLVVPEYNHG